MESAPSSSKNSFASLYMKIRILLRDLDLWLPTFCPVHFNISPLSKQNMPHTKHFIEFKKTLHFQGYYVDYLAYITSLTIWIITDTLRMGQKSVKMAEIRKSRTRSPIKYGYFLLLMKLLDLNSDIGSQPF